MHPPFPDDPAPIPVARRADDWIRYSAERAASIGLVLLLATSAAIAKQRAYRTLLGITLLSANLALVLAFISRWRRPASGAWNLFICCAVILAMAIQLAVLSAVGLFPIAE